jgi:type III pantothenate kinase
MTVVQHAEPGAAAPLLALDIGNTQIKVGVWDGQAWGQTKRARTRPEETADEYAVLLRDFLGPVTLAGVVIGSVVPPLTATFAELARAYWQIEPLIVSGAINTGIRLDVDSPEQGGADRIANSVAIHRLFGGPALGIGFGTATAFDVITEDGRYIGGSIAPGVGVALDALVGRTALLHKVTLEAPPSAIGRNTTNAIQSGVVLGYLGLVEGLITRLKAAMPGGDRAQVIATGGYAHVFMGLTPMVDQVAPQLTLDGLRILYALNT